MIGAPAPACAAAAAGIADAAIAAADPINQHCLIRTIDRLAASARAHLGRGYIDRA